MSTSGPVEIGGGEVIMDDAGHLPNLEDPATFNRHLGRFLDRRPR